MSHRSFALDSSSNRTAQRLHDPTLSNRAFAIFFIVTILIAFGLLLAPRAGALDLWWDTSNGAGLQAGNGIWSTIAADNNWNTSASPGGGGRVTWTNLSDAFFNASGTSAVTVSGTVQVNSMTFNGTGYTIGGTTLTLTGSNITTNVDATISAPLGGSVGLTKLGTAILTLSGTAANTYTGTTTVNAGELDLNKTGVNAVPGDLIIGDGTGTDTVKLLANDQIANTSDVTINSSGVLNLNSKNETIDGLSSASSTSSITLGTGTLTIGANNQATGTFAGVISGTGGNLVKSGTGTQTLTGNNTYTGTTTINSSGGTLEINNTNSSSSGRISGTSGVTVNSGGTLLLSGSSSWTDRINDSATMTLSGGTLNLNGLSERGGTVGAPTAGVGALTLTATSTINFGAGTTSIIEFNGLGTHTAGTILQITNWDGIPGTGGGTERLLFAGTASSFTSLYTQSDVSFNGVTGYFTDQFGSFYEVTAVPEPSTWIGGALALAALGYSQRKRFGRVLKRA